MDFASRYQKMSLHDCLSQQRKDELQTEDLFTDSNFAVPPGLDVSSDRPNNRLLNFIVFN